MIKKEIINFFYHLKEERRSAFWIIGASFLVFLLPSFYSYLMPTPKIKLADFEEQISQLKEDIQSDEAKRTFEPRKKSYETKKWKKTSTYSKKENTKVAAVLQPFSFDPNTATETDFLKMGLSERRVKTILNFRNKGAKFYKNEDFKKIYGLTDSEYNQLEPFIKIPPKEKKTYPFKSKPEPKFAKQKSEVVRIDINQSSEEDWQRLSGIGPYYSKKIVNFRDKLGGFSSIEQVATTYGLKDSTFQIIKPFLIESPIFKKIKVNTASVEELKSHPYLKWQQAKTVIKYRENHGEFTSITDLGKVGVLSESDLDRLEPYVQF